MKENASDAEIIRKESTLTSLTVYWTQPIGDVTHYQLTLQTTGETTLSVKVDK